MRYPGENATGRAPGRRPNPSGGISPAQGRPAAGGEAASDASLFAPGYSGGRAAGSGRTPPNGTWPGSPGGAWSGSPGGASRGPVRGFPPAPRQRPPLYPPGQFAAWNREPAPGENGYDPGLTDPLGGGWGVSYPDTADAPRDRHGDVGYSDAGYADAGYADAGYSDGGYSGQDYELQHASPAAAALPPAPAGSAPRRVATGPFDAATPAPLHRGGTAPDQRAATGPDTDVAGPTPVSAPGRRPGTRGRGSRGRKRARRHGKLRAVLTFGAALIVVAGVAYVFLTRGHKPPAPAADSRPAASARPSTDPSPSPSLGPWGHIGSRALDPAPLTLAELFPGSFTNGTASYVRTVQKAKTHCTSSLVGSGLIAAVGHAGCTQAMRASYLSSDHKLMGTIGVLNLITATAAERAGKAAGPSEFIAQLPAARGPTKNLTRGTGFEGAEVKGHYLVLVWAEFANLHTPRTALQKSELAGFITLLMQKTANVSLATRQVTGRPPS